MSESDNLIKVYKNNRWLFEQNAVATQYGFVNGLTGEQLTSDKTLSNYLDITEIPKPNFFSPQLEAVKDLLLLIKSYGYENVINSNFNVDSDDEREIEESEIPPIPTAPPPTDFILDKSEYTIETTTLNSENNDIGYQITFGKIKKDGVYDSSNPITPRLIIDPNQKWKATFQPVTLPNNETWVDLQLTIQRKRKDQNMAISFNQEIDFVYGTSSKKITLNLTIPEN